MSRRHNWDVFVVLCSHWDLEARACPVTMPPDTAQLLQNNKRILAASAALRSRDPLGHLVGGPTRAPGVCCQGGGGDGGSRTVKMLHGGDKQGGKQGAHIQGILCGLHIGVQSLVLSKLALPSRQNNKRARPCGKRSKAHLSRRMKWVEVRLGMLSAR